MMTGDKVGADDALAMGMVYKVCEDEALTTTAFGIAETLSRMPTKGIGLTKRLLNQSFDNNLEQQLAAEETEQAAAGTTYDYQEGVQAFLENESRSSGAHDRSSHKTRSMSGFFIRRTENHFSFEDSSAPALNLATFLAAILIGLPVCGLRLLRAARLDTEKGTETHEGNAVTFLQGLGGHSHESFERTGCVGLRNLGFARDGFDQFSFVHCCWF